MTVAPASTTLRDDVFRGEVNSPSGKLPGYPSYRPSNIRWHGDIPIHWMVRKVSHAFRILGSGTTPKSDEYAHYDGGVIPWVTTGELRESIITETGQSITKQALSDYPTLRIYPKGTLLFAMYGATIGRMGFLGVPATVNQACCALANSPWFTERFVYYWLLMRRPVLIMLSSGGGQPNLSQDDIREIRIPAPPTDEQEAIVNWLDDHTRRIDELVAAKRRLIDLLAEQRKAHITKAVTKGLDPAVPMKSSGIDWLGHVPKHWHVKRLRHLVSEPLQYGANEPAELDDPALPRFVRITDVDGSGRLREETFKSLPEDVAKPFLLRQGDLLLARSGATVGKAFYYDQSWGRCCYAGYLIRARLNPARLVAKFAHYCTQSDGYWQWIASSFIQATIQNVSAEKYANFWLGVPPLAEQRAIVAHLDATCANLDALTSAGEAVIARLLEYRQALITAAVTGKIDVRKGAKR